MRELWVDWSQVFANLCVPISILVGIFVFSEQRHDQRAQIEAQAEAGKAQDRRTAALQFVTLKHQDSYLNPAARISAAFARPQLIQLLGQLEGDARQEVLSDATNKAGLNNFATMADLYRAVIACREDQLCDRETVDAAYRSEITQFYCLSRESALPMLAKQLNDPDYAAPIARYAQKCRS